MAQPLANQTYFYLCSLGYILTFIIELPYGSSVSLIYKYRKLKHNLFTASKTEVPTHLYKRSSHEKNTMITPKRLVFNRQRFDHRQDIENFHSCISHQLSFFLFPKAIKVGTYSQYKIAHGCQLCIICCDFACPSCYHPQYKVKRPLSP